MCIILENLNKYPWLELTDYTLYKDKSEANTPSSSLFAKPKTTCNQHFKKTYLNQNVILSGRKKLYFQSCTDIFTHILYLYWDWHWTIYREGT